MIVAVQITQFDERRPQLQVIQRKYVPAIQLVHLDQRGETLRSLAPSAIDSMPITQGAEHGSCLHRGLFQSHFAQQLVRVVIILLGRQQCSLGNFSPQFGVTAQSRLVGPGRFRFQAQPGLFAFCLDRAAPRAAFLQKKPRRGRRSHQQRRRHCCPGSEYDTISANQLLEAVPAAGRTGGDRLIVQVTLDVHRQTVRRFVPASAVLFQSFHNDPIQITPKF